MMRRLWRLFFDEDGQVLIFGVLTLFMLALGVVVVYDVGSVVAKRVQLQQAADAASAAGAQIEGNAISSVAWMNDGMAYIYYNICRYAVDVGIYGTMAELKQTGPPYPSDDVVGTSDAVGKYNEAYARASEWIPRGEAMLEQISKIEGAIALATPVLVEQEVYRVAKENGVDRAAIFPKFVMFPDPDSHFILDLRKIPRGWEMSTDDGDQIIAQVTGEESWWISATVDDETVEISVEKIGDDLFKIEYTDDDGTKIIYIQRTPYGDIISEGDDSVTMKQNDDGSTTITEDGKSLTYRVTDNNSIEVKQGDGDWQVIVKQDSVSVDGGPSVRVDNFINIQVGSNTWVAPKSVWIHNIHVVLTDPLEISGRLGMAWIGIHENEAVVNSLNTKNADGDWKFRGHGHNQSDMQTQDRARHRMTEFTEGEEWQYEYVKAASYLFPDNTERFVRHAFHDNDPWYRARGEYPSWSTWYEDEDTGREGWFNMEIGRANNWEDYKQVRVCWSCDGTGEITTEDGPVRCPLCDAQDNDGDGKTDILVTMKDSLDRAGNPGYDQNGADMMSIDMDRFENPLVVTEDFFKFGINVGVWGKPVGVPGNLLGNPNWGMFSLASARIGFYDPETDEFTTRFPTAEDRVEWVERSPLNLYEPTWEFRMVSTRDAVLSEDIDSYTEYDTGANYLYRGMAHSHWRDGYYGDLDLSIEGKMYGMNSPWDKRFDLTVPELEGAIKH
ncbi:pilus assembly protein TadG-related protein [Planctomycetota bacterium]